jgi:hypothetical protein
MEAIKQLQAKKLEDPADKDEVQRHGRPRTAPVQVRGKSLVDCDTDEERLAALESRLGGLLQVSYVYEGVGVYACDERVRGRDRQNSHRQTRACSLYRSTVGALRR